MKGQTSLLQAQGLMNVFVLSTQIEKKIRIHQVQSCDVELHPVVRHDPARGERSMPAGKCRTASGMAMIQHRDNETSVQPQPRAKREHAMGTARREPRGG